MKRSWVIRTVVAITLSTCLIVALLSMGQPQTLGAVFTRVSLVDIGIWIVLYGILVLFRAIRFQQAYPKVGLQTLIRAISVQGGLNRIMPFRLGELSLPYLISQREVQPSGAILFALGWVRLLELFLVCSGMAVGGFLMRQGYYSAAVETSKEYMSADEWGYWFEGKAAKGDIVNPQGVKMESAGAVRDGGSFYDRMGSVACWNAVMEENQYMVRKWNEFIAS